MFCRFELWKFLCNFQKSLLDLFLASRCFACIGRGSDIIRPTSRSILTRHLLGARLRRGPTATHIHSSSRRRARTRRGPNAKYNNTLSIEYPTATRSKREAYLPGVLDRRGSKREAYLPGSSRMPDRRGSNAKRIYPASAGCRTGEVQTRSVSTRRLPDA